MPSDNDHPLLTGTVYRSRINDILTMSDSNAIGRFSIAQLNTQYNNVGELDEVQSRTFDADSDGIVLGFTDFSNSVNRMDENHWLQIDSDGYGNNMLGDQLDFAPERPGRQQPPVYNIGITNLKAQPSIVSSLAENQIDAFGILVSGNSNVAGVAERQVNGTASLETGVSTVAGNAERTINNLDTSLEAQASTVDGLAENIINGSGILEAEVSTVDGASERIITCSGTLEAQASTVNGLSDLENIAFGNLEAQASTVDATSERTIPSSGILEAQASTVDGLAENIITGSGTLQAQVSTVVGAAENIITASGALEAQASSVVGVSENITTGSGSLQAQVVTVVGAGSITPVRFGSGTLEAQASTVVGSSLEERDATGTLEAQASTVSGLSENIITGSGTLQVQASSVVGASEREMVAAVALEAQASSVDGLAENKVSGAGTLEAQASTVDGAGNTIEPYVGMPSPDIYVGMTFPDIYVEGVIRTVIQTHTGSGDLESSSSGVDGLQPVMLGTYYYDNLLGDDIAGNGSAATPWASIDKVLTDGLVPGYNAIGIDNGPQNPYRINTSGIGTVYVSNKRGTALNPISLDGDPNSTAYLGGYPDRPTTQYPNTYITNAVTQTGWTLSSVYTNVYESTNPYPSTAANKSQLFGCTASEWTADGIMAVKRAYSLTWRSLSDPADLVAGEWWCDANKIYYYPNAGENMSTRHMEFCDNKSIMSMKRCDHLSVNNIAFVCVGGTVMGSQGRGVSWEASGEGTGYVNDWCSYITVNSSLFKYCRTATSFNIGEYYFLNNSTATDLIQNGFGFFGSRGDFDAYANGDPGSNRSFPVSNTLMQDCHVKRTKNNDGIVFHKNSGYSDVNNDGNTRYDDVGSNHEVVRCTSSDNEENGFDITSGLNITILNCVSHNNRGSGITMGHYVRNVSILNHVSYNDDASRNFGGGMNIGDSRNVLIDNMSTYNPGSRSISIRADAGNVVIKNSKFISGPDTNKSSVIEIFEGSGPEFGTTPRNGSTYAKQTPTSALPNPFLSCATPPVRQQNILIKDNRFDIPFGGIKLTEPEANFRFKYFVYLEILPILGYDYDIQGNVFRTSSNNTQWQPNTASDLPASDYGPYKAKNTTIAHTTGGQPVVDVIANQTYFAAGNFPNESDMWNFWPSGVTPVGRNIATKFIGEASGVYNTDIGFTTNDTQTDMPLYSSAHNISGQSTYWEPATVQGLQNDPSLEYWEKTTWTIAAPSTTATTSRAVAYIDTGFSNVSVQEPWSGDHRVSGGPLICMNSAVSEFGLSFVWYAGAAGNASYLALFEVGQQDTDLNLVGISAPYPHTDGVEVRLVMEVEDGVLRCYAGIRPDTSLLITPDNKYSATLIPLTTTEGGATFSDTYDVATNNSNLNGSTTHGTYIYNNQVAASRTANLRYSVYPPVMRGLT